MTTQTEALKMALEMLKDNQHLVADNERHAYVMAYNRVIKRCEEALAQPEQEPVAWESILGAIARGWCYEENANKTIDKDLAEAIAKEVYALYTTPPQHSAIARKPLTDEQREKIAANVAGGGVNWTLGNVIDAVEAAHGIKE